MASRGVPDGDWERLRLAAFTQVSRSRIPADTTADDLVHDALLIALAQPPDTAWGYRVMTVMRHIRWEYRRTRGHTVPLTGAGTALDAAEGRYTHEYATHWEQFIAATGMGHGEAARLCGMGRPNFSAYSRGSRVPSAAQRARINNALGCIPDEEPACGAE